MCRDGLRGDPLPVRAPRHTYPRDTSISTQTFTLKALVATPERPASPRGRGAALPLRHPRQRPRPSRAAVPPPALPRVSRLPPLEHRHHDTTLPAPPTPPPPAPARAAPAQPATAPSPTGPYHHHIKLGGQVVRHLGRGPVRWPALAEMAGAAGGASGRRARGLLGDVVLPRNAGPVPRRGRRPPARPAASEGSRSSLSLRDACGKVQSGWLFTKRLCEKPRRLRWVSRRGLALASALARFQVPGFASDLAPSPAGPAGPFLQPGSVHSEQWLVSRSVGLSRLMSRMPQAAVVTSTASPTKALGSTHSVPHRQQRGPPAALSAWSAARFLTHPVFCLSRERGLNLATGILWETAVSAYKLLASIGKLLKYRNMTAFHLLTQGAKYYNANAPTFCTI